MKKYRSLLLIFSLLMGLMLIFNSCATDENDNNDDVNEEEENTQYPPLDYLAADLSEYIFIDPEKYKNYSLSLQIAKPHEIDTDVTILGLLYEKRGSAVSKDPSTSGKISAGDEVNIYYRGYLKDEDGKEVEVDGMCNFESSSPSKLAIGSGSFVPGFELDLVGVEFSEANQLVKGEDGAVSGEFVLVECYFPYNYQKAELRNQTAYFEVYIHGIVKYEEPEYTDSFVEELINSGDIGVAAEDIEKYDGGYAEKLRAYIKDLLNKNYENEYKEALTEAVWNYYTKDDVSVIKKYPDGEVKNVYNGYLADVKYQFELSGGNITTSYGFNKFCSTLDEYATIYLGLEFSDKNWKSYLREMAELSVKEKLILYYIMREEQLVPVGEALSEKVDALKQEYLDDYIDRYLDVYKKDRDDYSEDEWKKFTSDRAAEIYDYYGEEYFAENVYYETAINEFLKWPTVKTLDK